MKSKKIIAISGDIAKKAIYNSVCQKRQKTEPLPKFKKICRRSLKIPKKINFLFKCLTQTLHFQLEL